MYFDNGSKVCIYLDLYRSGITNSLLTHISSIEWMWVTGLFVNDITSKINWSFLFVCILFYFFYWIYIVKQHLLSYSIEIPHWVQILFWFFENSMAIIVYRRLWIFFKAKDVWAGVNHSHISYLTKPRKLALKTN